MLPLWILLSALHPMAFVLVQKRGCGSSFGCTTKGWIKTLVMIAITNFRLNDSHATIFDEVAFLYKML